MIQCGGRRTCGPESCQSSTNYSTGDRQELSEKQFVKRKAEAAGLGYADIIEVTQYVDGLTYRPHTTETHASEIYQLILSSVHTALGD